MINDSGHGSEKRVIIFANNLRLQWLSAANIWYMDGNFTLAPQLSKHFYVILVQILYENMPRTILKECEARNLYYHPEKVKIDFETLVIEAVKVVLGQQ